MRKIQLCGHLGKKFGRFFELDVSSPAEAIRALRANFPDFEAYMLAHSEPGYRVFVGKESVDEAGLNLISSKSTIKIVPVVRGAGRGGIGQILIGTLIVVAAFYTGGASMAAFSGFSGMAMSFGASLLIGGVAQMLTKSPSVGQLNSVNNRPSYAFNGPVNTVAQGNPVPILYGRLIVGSQVISAGMSIDQTLVSDTVTTAPKSPINLLHWSA
ncbi:tail assembly protein [Glaciimonas soli]|uniref:Tail assembly protein n=1 Tax=Glaciimonas soli TaxID=2590999 RepID=A0A843YRU0_9BURK|nr:tail assembly protein [Glaciimonas soli]MQR02469.1 tail assembly protein [Glaciimonas soli]